MDCFNACGVFGGNVNDLGAKQFCAMDWRRPWWGNLKVKKQRGKLRLFSRW